MPALDDSIQFVKGIGPKKAKLFEKLHIRTLRDALETYPRDYEDRTRITRIADIGAEDKYTVRAVVGTEPKLSRIRKGLTLVKCTIFDESGLLHVTWFNNPYAAALVRAGQEYVFYGRIQGFGRARTPVSYTHLASSHASSISSCAKRVSRRTSGLNQCTDRAATSSSLSHRSPRL